MRSHGFGRRGFYRLFGGAKRLSRPCLNRCRNLQILQKRSLSVGLQSHGVNRHVDIGWLDRP
jgi:hypothetical protein